MVLIRDVSASVGIRDLPATFSTLVLDVDTGLALGASPGSTPDESTRAAFTSALTTAPPPLKPGAPGRALRKGEHVAVVNRQLREFTDADQPDAKEIIPGDDAGASSTSDPSSHCGR